MVMNALLISLLGLVFLGILKFLERAWWTPIRVHKAMVAQGIRGPPPKFIYGNSREAAAMVKESMSRPVELISHDILSRVQPHLHVWRKNYGKNFLKWKGTVPQLSISEPELIKEVLSNKGGAFIKHSASKFMKKLLGDGLVTTEGKKWIRQRKLANHAFRAESLKGMIPAIVTSVEDMLKRWTNYDDKEVDLFREFHVLTYDVISRTAFSNNYIQGKNIFSKLTDLAKIVARNAETVDLPLLSKLMRSDDEKLADIVENEIHEMIIRLVKKREENNRIGYPEGYGSDFLGLLLKSNHENENDERITLEDIVDECKTFYFAGHETTASLLSWTALLLAINTEWQEKARQEVTELFGHRYPTSDDTSLARMKIMTMILNESLRLYPPIILILRKVAKEVKLGNYVLPEGLVLEIPPLVVQHDTELWGEDAHVFKPERFSEGVSRATNNTMSFLPFGAGPRICVGQGLAMMEAKIALSMILQSFSFTISPAYVHAPVMHIAINPQFGVQVILNKLVTV